LLIYMLNYLLFLSMVHEYTYFLMNIFGNRSTNTPTLDITLSATAFITVVSK